MARLSPGLKREGERVTERPSLPLPARCARQVNTPVAPRSRSLVTHLTTLSKFHRLRHAPRTPSSRSARRVDSGGSSSPHAGGAKRHPQADQHKSLGLRKETQRRFRRRRFLCECRAIPSAVIGQVGQSDRSIRSHQEPRLMKMTLGRLGGSKTIARPVRPVAWGWEPPITGSPMRVEPFLDYRRSH